MQQMDKERYEYTQKHYKNSAEREGVKFMETSTYWEERGHLAFQYKNETFYTVTPIPYYYRRRSYLLELMTPYLEEVTRGRICDFGCGDGWYLKFFSSKLSQLPGREWHGIDMSKSMIERAQSYCPHASLHVSAKGIQFDTTFDLVYSVAVFAHILDDANVIALFNNIASRTRAKGRFLLFEQTGPRRKRGETWIKRKSSDYVEYARQAGWIVEKKLLIAFPAHRFFEKHIAPYWYKLFYSNQNFTERCILANRSILFRTLSSLMLSFTSSPLREDDDHTEGNTFYVFSKN